MSQKWQVICIIWVVCGIVAISINTTWVLLIPAVGTAFASE